MIKVDLNLSILLKDYPFVERFAKAAELGFVAVEFYWDKDHDPKAIARAVLDNGLSVAAFNLDAGELQTGDRGLLNDPKRRTQMRENLPVAFDLAQKVGCKKLTALAGNLRAGEEREKQIDRIRENLRWICEEASGAGITIMVEAINAFDNKLYPFTNTADTIAFLDSVGAPNLEYLYDIYHMQRMEGNIIGTLEKHIERIGHVQIADSPLRRHPGTGEINYRRVFEAIEKCDYQDSIGLEYIADGSTEESLRWLPREHRAGIHLESLELQG
jgi:hydroxypyruvate isomerase